MYRYDSKQIKYVYVYVTSLQKYLKHYLFAVEVYLC